MEQFRAARAWRPFAGRGKIPAWIPGRVNLAIAALERIEGRKREIALSSEGVLKDEPDQPHANYTLGILKKRPADLTGGFIGTLKRSCGDHETPIPGCKKATATDGDDPVAALECFRRALQLDPYLNSARYKLFSLAALMQNGLPCTRNWINCGRPSGNGRTLKCHDMGPYAEVISRTPETAPPHPVGPIPSFQPVECIPRHPGRRRGGQAAADLGTDRRATSGGSFEAALALTSPVRLQSRRPARSPAPVGRHSRRQAS